MAGDGVADASVEAELQPDRTPQTETSAHPIAQAPTAPAAMPWDQVEEGPVTITPTSSSLESSVTEEPAALPPAHWSASIPEPVATVEPVVPAIEVLSQSGSHLIVEIPKTPAPMPWDQVEEAVILIPPPAKQTTPAAEDHVAAPVEDGVHPYRLRRRLPGSKCSLQTSSQPIAQARRVRVPCHGITFRGDQFCVCGCCTHIRQLHCANRSVQ